MYIYIYIVENKKCLKPPTRKQFSRHRTETFASHFYHVSPVENHLPRTQQGTGHPRKVDDLTMWQPKKISTSWAANKKSWGQSKNKKWFWDNFFRHLTLIPFSFLFGWFWMPALQPSYDVSIPCGWAVAKTCTSWVVNIPMIYRLSTSRLRCCRISPPSDSIHYVCLVWNLPFTCWEN